MEGQNAGKRERPGQPAPNPETPESLISLSASLRMKGDFQSSLAAARHACQAAPDSAHAYNNLGLTQLALSELPQAAQSFERATNLTPALTEAFFNLGSTLFKLGSRSESEMAFDKAIDMVSWSPTALTALGSALLGQGQAQKALVCGQRAIALGSEDVTPRFSAPRPCFTWATQSIQWPMPKQAIDFDPESPSAHSVYAAALEGLGMIPEARGSHLRAIELDPNHVQSYVAISLNQSASQVDKELVYRMERLASASNLHAGDSSMLHYGLGRSYEQLEEYELAMRHYDEANRIARYLKLGNIPVNKVLRKSQIDNVKRLFTKEAMAQHIGHGIMSETPVFIVGMIRSGTTLMEQILSSHPSVAAGGELPFWMENAGQVIELGGAIKFEGLARLANEYLATLNSVSSTALRVTDKMPANVTMLGLLRFAFPNAKVVHMRRNGADTCFSIYATPNGARSDFLHHKESIAFEYGMYLELMNHWRSVLPSDWFMDVVYEDLVDDPEHVTRQVLQFCGLEWSELCLSPEKNDRAVTTPSLWQVRQPVYKTAKQRWRNFEPWVEPFKRFA